MNAPTAGGPGTPSIEGWRPKLEALRHEAQELHRELSELREMLDEHAAPTETLSDGAMVLDGGRHALRIHGREMPLTRLQYRLVRALLRDPGAVVTWDALQREVAPWARGEQYRLVTAHVSRLRHKLGSYASRLETVFGVGLRWRRSE